MRRFVLAAAALLAAPAAARAQTVTSLSNDAAYNALLAAGTFTKFFGGQARAGRAGAADWEYAVVNNTGAATLSPTGEVDWAADAVRDFRFAWTGTQASMLVDGADGVRTATVGAPAGGSVNAIVFRSLASGTGVVGGFSSNLLVTFLSGGSTTIGGFLGDADAEYRVLVDARLAGGFTVTGEGTVQGRTGGSNPMYEFKVGQASVVPEPSTYALFAAGLAGVAGVARRRRTR